jgi:putative MATE family efflux protein
MSEHKDSQRECAPGIGAVATDRVLTLAPSPIQRGRGIWATLKEAIGGSEQDYTRGSIGRAVWLLAVPMVLEMSMESVFAVVDMFFVSRLSVDAVAAVGLTEGVLSLVYSIAVGLSMATSAMVARRIGEKRAKAASLAAVQAIGLALLVSLAIAVPGALLAPWVLQLMGGSESLIAIGSGYTAVIFGGAASIVLIFVINAVFRGAGDPALAMQTLWLANGINLVLDPCLIFGLGPFPQLGLVGAAVATTVGRSVGVIYQIANLRRGRSRIRFGRSHMTWQPALIRRLLRVTAGGTSQSLIATSSWVVLVKLISGFGSTAVAGYAIAIRIVIFTIMPAWGISNAAATLMGQNLGAKQPDRAEKSVWRVAWYNVVFMTLVALFFITGAEWLIRVFTSDPSVIGHGKDCLRIVSYGYGFYAVAMVVVQAFNGAGDTTTPTVINLFCYWLFQLPLAALLARSLVQDAQGVFWAITIAESVMAIVAVVVFRRGKWRTREI